MNRNIFLDGIFGVVTGDALGDSVQYMSREEVIRRGLVTGIERHGKNWYVHTDGCVITVNASSYTIITCHRE